MSRMSCVHDIRPSCVWHEWNETVDVSVGRDGEDPGWRDGIPLVVLQFLQPLQGRSTCFQSRDNLSKTEGIGIVHLSILS